MSQFDQEYQKLNKPQKEAVDTVYGPLMVVAGPGTGKTQLLSMRVANILRTSDVLPRNILCLTFTESAAMAMRERLLGLIGIDAHKVAIHTFHSFGVEVINQYPQYFYNGAQFTPSDEVLQMEIVREILQNLPYDNPLTSTMNDSFVYIKAIIQAIENLKKAGLDAHGLRTILDDNQAVIDKFEPLLGEAFNVTRFSKSHIPGVREALEAMPQGREADIPEPFQPLHTVIRNSLETAVSEAEESGSTKPITAWKSVWLQKNEHNQYVFKDRANNERLYALAEVYQRYQAELHLRERYDFADMVLQVLHVLETYPEFRYELQEQYQFLLVDEFQDSNDVQLRILYALADNPVHEGNPDFMVVGDDDQAIYKFQGAEVSNILHFRDMYPEAPVVTLRENYRSRQNLLDVARPVITQGETRLETALPEVEKTLRAAGSSGDGTIVYARMETPVHEYTWVAREIRRLIDDDGMAAGNIAVIGRQHASLEQLMPHLRTLDVPVVYERRQNVLEEHHITQLIELTYAVQALAEGEHERANEYVSRVLSFPFWQIDPVDIWRISSQAYQQRMHWLDIMLESQDPYIAKIARFLLECSQRAASEPLEYVLDRLIGSRKGDEFRSPYREYHFSDQRFDHNRGEYVAFLSALRLLRERLQGYRSREVIYLRDFVEFIELHRENDMPIVDETPFVSSEDAVHVLTAHKAKGQEYDTVFIIDGQESVWAKSKDRNRITFPGNMPIKPAGDALDDQLRLFFVAMTRARSNLYITGYERDNAGKPSPLVPFLDHSQFTQESLEPEAVADALERSWQSYHPLPRTSDAHAVLKPILDTYQLNVTHFLKFLNVVWSGPHTFLLESMLRFPQAQTASAAYGSAVHATLREAYRYIENGWPLEDEAILDAFEGFLRQQRMREHEYEKYRDQGRKELPRYLGARKHTFEPGHLIETNFKNQGVTVEGARLSGAIDKMVLNQDSSCQVYDFKTGKPLTGWSKNNDHEALKAWRYQTQLIFYKLLVENSRSWSEYTVDRGTLEFVRPYKDDIVTLELAMEDADVSRVASLIGAVWERIQNLDFPDVSGYEKDMSGIRQFEDDLLADYKPPT